MGFFEEYFVQPIIDGSGYNVYNTIVYALILIAAVFVIFKVIKKMGIKIDDKFLFGVLPFVVLGGLLRALEDAQNLTVWLKTPLIYIVIFALAFGTLIISKLLEKRLAYHKIWFASGALIVIAFLTQVKVTSMLALGAIFVLALFWALLLVFVKKISNKYTKIKFFSWENTALLAVHMFDATTTFVALSYFPYFEQHVLPAFLINVFGPAVMFVLKFVVVSLVLYALDKEVEREKRKFVKFAILVLGLAPGLRNFFRLIMGV